MLFGHLNAIFNFSVDAKGKKSILTLVCAKSYPLSCASCHLKCITHRISFTIFCLNSLRISATVTALLAWIFAVSAASVCNFMVREGNDSFSTLRAGLFVARYDNGYDDECRSFDYYDLDVDDAIRAGQAFAVMSSLFGGLVLVAMIVGIFIRYPPIIWRIMVVALFVLVPLQSLTLSALGAEFCTDERYDDGCVPSAGAILSNFATLLWLVAGILLCQMPPPEKAPVPCSCCQLQLAYGQQQGYGQQQQPPASVAISGERTKTTTVETINKDGSKTITTTVNA